MDEWTLPGWVIPFAWILVGWTIGFIDSNRRTSKKIKQAENSAAVAIKNAEDKTAEARAKMAEASTTPYSVDEPGLMRIKNENGNLTLDLDGARVDPTALTAEQRKRLILMVNAIRPWLEGKPSGPPPPASPSLLKPIPAPIAPTPPPQAIQQPVATQTPSKKADEPELPPTSIVGQINLILQSQIINTPLASLGVTLLESPSGSVNVYVGIDKYESVDEVPNEGIKIAIRAAIAEWERRYTPGLS